MQLGEQIFNAIYASLPDGRASLSFVDGSFDCAAVCSSVSETRKNTEYGLGFMSGNQVKIVKGALFDSAFPEIRAIVGKSVTMVKMADGLTRNFTIEAYSVLSGVITLTLGDVA